jgi:GT2 family glycosyltransferase
VRFVFAKKRLYDVGCRNLGIKLAKSDFLFFIDDDNVLPKNTINVLVDTFMQLDRVGFCGPVTYYLSSPKTIWSSGAYLGKWSGRYVAAKVPSDKNIYEVESIPNAYMTRMKVIKDIGVFNINFPLQETEHEIQVRARKKGYKVVINKNAKIFHDFPLGGLESRLDPTRIYLIWRNRLWLEKMHNPQRYSSMKLFLPMYCTYYLFLISKKEGDLSHKYNLVKQLTRGILHGLLWHPAHVDLVV